jgi:hypothetical protein
MFQTIVRRPYGLLCGALLLLAQPGFCRADALDDARATVARIRANISLADTQISNRQADIVAADIAIALNEAALNKAIADNNGPAEVTCRLLKVALTTARDTKVREMQQWERFRQGEQDVLPLWEAEVRRLGG